MWASLKQRIAKRISTSRDIVFLPRDFADLGGYSQVLRALRQLCEEGAVVRAGYGIYAKALIDPLTDEPIAADGPSMVMRDAFNKLGIEWDESQAVKDYNAGTSTQIPVNPIPTVRGRFSRKINVNGLDLTYRNA